MIAIDIPRRRIVFNSEHLTRKLYCDLKRLWKNDSFLIVYPFPLEAVGLKENSEEMMCVIGEYWNVIFKGG